jgi:polar amino acid transport system substrate-binding protein
MILLSFNRIVFIAFLLLFSCLSLAEDCIVVFGMSETNYRPYSWVEEDETVHGLNIDLIDRLTTRAGCELIVKVLRWNELLVAFNNFEVDTIATSLSPYTDTIKGNDLLQIPITTMFYGNFYVRKNSVDIKSVDDLYGKKVVVLKGSTSHDHARHHLIKKYAVEIVEYDTTEDAILALSSGHGDVGLFSMTAARNAVESENINNLKLSGAAFLPASYGFIFHKEKQNVFYLLNEQLELVFGMQDYSDNVNSWSKEYNSIDETRRQFFIVLVLILLIVLIVVAYNYILDVKVEDRTKKLNVEIEHRKTLEKEKSLMKEQSMSIAKLAALGEMASCVAHEINNPTALIIHNVSFLKRKTSALLSMIPDTKDKAVIFYQIEDTYNIIDDSLKRTVKSINQLKRVGNNCSEQVEDTDLCKGFKTALELTNFYVSKYTCNLIVNIPEQECRVFCVENTVEQIVINLLQNACHALLNSDGIIKCGITSDIVDGVNYYKLYVNDTGVGISESDIGCIFKPFYTTRKDRGGTGLGLSIVKRLVKDNDAIIDCRSVEGEGTCVSVYFKAIK